MWEVLLRIVQESSWAVAVFAIISLVGAALEWWVWGYFHRREITRREEETQRMVKDRDFWMAQALDAIGVGEEVAEVALDLADTGQEKAS